MQRQDELNPLHPEDDEPVCDTDFPYIINEENFDDSPLEHRYFTYWAINDILTDDQDKEVDFDELDKNNFDYFHKTRYGEVLFVCNEYQGFVARIDKTYEDYTKSLYGETDDDE